MPGYLSTSSEFVVNSAVTGHQSQPRIVHFSNGNYVVVWSDYGATNPDNTGTIRAQLFDTHGNRIGTEFQVNSSDFGWQSAPEVTVLADNSFVVTWQTDDSNQDGSGRAIVAQRFAADGTPLGGEFVVNTTASGFQNDPHITALANGGFVIAWDDTFTKTIRTQAYAADGTPVGTEMVVASYSATYSTSFDLRPTASGGYVVAWTTATANGDDIRAQIFAADGTPAGGAIAVNSLATGSQLAPHITVLANGNFLVAWTTYDTTQDGSATAIKAQLFDSLGNPLGSEFLINQASAGYQFSPQLSALPDGGFIAVWSTWPVAGSWDNSLVARTFDASGQPTGDEFQVNAYLPDTQYLGGITTLPDGRVLVTYSSYGVEGLVNDEGILIHTLAPSGPNTVAPSIISNGGGSSAVVAVNEYSSTVTSVRAFDPDGPQATTFAITGGDDAALFTIDPVTGRLSFVTIPQFASPTDFDGDNVYDVVITASDGTLTDSQFIQVAVQDIVEAITVTSPTDIFTPENDNLVHGGISATSASGLPVYFQVIGGPDAALVTITQDGYFIFAPGFAPDFESPADANGDNVFEVTVIMGDGFTSATVDVLIHVTDLNELDFISPSEVTMVENGSFVVTVQATTAGSVVYTVSGGADQFLFDIDPLTGDLSFLNSPDYESWGSSNYDNVYELAVTAWDQITGATATQVISITVTNEIEAPIFYSSDYAGILENQLSALQVQAYSPEGNALSFSIQQAPGDNSDGALFVIDPDTGALSFLTAPNYELPSDLNGDSLYEVVVAATDQVTGLTSTQRIYINVADVDDHPVFTSSNAFTVTEGTTFAATLTAAHPANHLPTFYLGGGADDALFTLDAATGVLTFNGAPDYEAPGDAGGNNVYDLVVWVSDGTTFTSQGITVTVGNLNEAPVITGSTVLAATENSTPVATLTSTDPENDLRSWSISGGADAALFVIDAQTGALSFVTAPDFETPADSDGDNQYLVQVTVSDGSLTASQLFTINLGDSNEAPLITSNGGGASASIAVTENASAVTTVTSTDPEGTTRTYAIVGGADAARFSINAATGVLSFIAPPDYEAPGDAGADNIYDVIVAASDGTLTDTQALAVTVGNANDAPVITSSGGGATASITVNENTTAVVTVTSTDPEGTARTYSIVGGADAARFTINPTTGVLSFISAPNWEAPSDAGGNNVYDVIVAASDGTLTDTQALAVTVGNVVDGSIINGTNSANTLNGTVAEDTIDGRGGNDTITGGLGADVLTGGSGADRFVYSALNHSTLSAPDRITDFSLSQNDRISLSGIDANTGLAGDQAFSWIGTGNFTNVAGQLRYYQSGGNTYVTGDVNGDGIGDFLIRIDPAVTLSASYFIL